MKQKEFEEQVVEFALVARQATELGKRKERLRASLLEQVKGGMIVGAGFAHNFTIASSAVGPSAFGPITVIVGLIICIVIGLTMRELKA